MNKREIAIVVVLFAALIGWFIFNSPKEGEQPSPPAAMEGTAVTNAAATNAVAAVLKRVDEPTETPPQESIQPPQPDPAPQTPVTPQDPAPVVARPSKPEQVIELSNEQTKVLVSSYGGGIIRVEYSEFRKELDAQSGPFTLDFRQRPALSFARFDGLSTNADFTIQPSDDGRTVTLEAKTAQGLQLKRLLSLQENYQLKVEDVLTNAGDEAIPVPRHALRLGLMSPVATKASTRGISYLGIDTLPDAAGESIIHWNKRRFLRSSFIDQFFEDEEGNQSDEVRDKNIGQSVAWAAVKNKFFVQLLVPLDESGAADCELYALRNPAGKRGKQVGLVGASLVFPERTLDPGESITRALDYYVGPKKYTLLKEFGRHQDKVMEFGKWFGWMCGPLLWILNAIHSVIPNYGVAIILLTVLVRLVFWPVMHKSTASMKRMQEIQPLVAELRKKHEGNAQKIQQETMALYKEHKVNPMASCLPMLIQIPVFIALFTVLRSAVELRFADFLWVSDLSEPEAIPLGALLFMKGPFSGLWAFSVNFLPLYMTVTMVLQQRLTPSSSDPQQKTMMMIMPIVMLVMFYNMASALVLYWSTSQTLAIVQMALQRKSGKKKDAAPQPASA